MEMTGIYKIQSRHKPERIYIGSTSNIKQRWYLHLSQLRKQSHHSIKLQQHFNKYGETDLQFSILLECEKDDLIKKEQFFIDGHVPYFNVCKIAGNTAGLIAWNKGKKGVFSLEAIKKMSISRLGNKNSLGRIGWNKGKKIGTSGMKGKHHSPESIKKLREAQKKRWENDNKGRQRMRGNTYAKGNMTMLNKTHTEDAKRKMKEYWESRKLNKNKLMP